MKVFLIINTSYFGDTILTSPLCQNIKKEYPDAWVVFIVNTPFYEVAKYMKDVDEVLCYDKRGEHQGLRGFWKFYRTYGKRYPQGIEAAFVIYGNERGIVLARCMGAKKVFADKHGWMRLLLDDNRTMEISGHIQDQHGAMLELLTNKKTESLPMRYIPPASAVQFVAEYLSQCEIQPDDELIALCTTSKRQEKDMPVDVCVQLIAGLRQSGKKVVLTGSGETAIAYRDALYERQCVDFLDMTNRTTIAQLGALLQRCCVLVSVDTGTMHFGLALAVPVVAIFYLNDPVNLARWAPKADYRHILLADGFCSAEQILAGVQRLEANGHA